MNLYLITIVVIFALLAMLVVVDRVYQRFAARHPDFGPFRTRMFGCGGCGKAGPDGSCHEH